MRKSILFILTLFLQTVHAGSSKVETMLFQGVDRLYRVHNIEATENNAAPMVLHLHGFRYRKEAEADRETLNNIAWEELEEAADKNGFLVVQPAAYWGRWSLFSGLKDITLDSGEVIDDLQFISNVVDKFVRSGLIDKNRIYLSGISDGGILSYRLLCELNLPFAATVNVVGTTSEKQITNCNPSTPIPIMVIAGTNDRILPYDGGLFPEGRDVSIPEIMEHWRLSHGCKKQKYELLEDRYPDDDSRVLAVTWTKCDRENAVKLLRVEGGGHAVPRYQAVSDSWREKGGGHNRDIESADEVWKFVEQFRFSR